MYSISPNDDCGCEEWLKRFAVGSHLHRDDLFAWPDWITLPEGKINWLSYWRAIRILFNRMSVSFFVYIQINLPYKLDVPPVYQILIVHSDIITDWMITALYRKAETALVHNTSHLISQNLGFLLGHFCTTALVTARSDKRWLKDIFWQLIFPDFNRALHSISCLDSTTGEVL